MLRVRALNHPQQLARRGPADHVDDRRTPPDLLAECAALAGVDGWDLDAAASAANTKAECWHDVDADGLRQPWHGRVWCNPPFSGLDRWAAKATAEATRCTVIALLLPANRTEQRWWQEVIEPQRLAGTIAVHFLAGRRRFDRPGWTKPPKGDRPPFGLCLAVWP
jgi:phage N-6-adenine-methyltransferase